MKNTGTLKVGCEAIANRDDTSSAPRLVWKAMTSPAHEAVVRPPAISSSSARSTAAPAASGARAPPAGRLDQGMFGATSVEAPERTVHRELRPVRRVRRGVITTVAEGTARRRSRCRGAPSASARRSSRRAWSTGGRPTTGR
jgi:hypothetical protein